MLLYDFLHFHIFTLQWQNSALGIHGLHSCMLHFCCRGVRIVHVLGSKRGSCNICHWRDFAEYHQICFPSICQCDGSEDQIRGIHALASHPRLLSLHGLLGYLRNIIGRLLDYIPKRCGYYLFHCASCLVGFYLLLLLR